MERVFVDHAELLARRGHTVYCLISENALCESDLLSLESRSEGRVVICRIVTRGWQMITLWWSLWRVLERVKPQVLVAHGAKSVSRLNVVRRSSLALLGITHNSSGRLLKATHLIALTAALCQSFESRGFPKSRIFVLPNPSPLWTSSAARRKPRERDGVITIGTLSRLVGKKGIDTFLRGLSIAIGRGLNAKAVIGGDGPERAKLEQLCCSLGLSERVRFLGWICAPTDFYSSIDWLCVPSREEPFGLVVLEGFAQGVPVLASSVGGLREMIVDGENGMAFDCDDPVSLADALMDLALCPKRENQLRNGAYERLEKFHPEQIITQVEMAIVAAIADQNARGVKLIAV